MAVVVEALDGGLLDYAIHPLDPLPGNRLLASDERGAVGPRVVWLGQPMLNPVGFADHVEAQ